MLFPSSHLSLACFLAIDSTMSKSMCHWCSMMELSGPLGQMQRILQACSLGEGHVTEPMICHMSTTVLTKEMGKFIYSSREVATSTRENAWGSALCWCHYTAEKSGVGMLSRGQQCLCSKEKVPLKTGKLETKENARVRVWGLASAGVSPPPL